jgi:hypothetical protein
MKNVLRTALMLLASAVKKMHRNRLIARTFTGRFVGLTEKHTGIFVKPNIMESSPIPKENACSLYFLGRHISFTLLQTYLASTRDQVRRCLAPIRQKWLFCNQ